MFIGGFPLKEYLLTEMLKHNLDRYAVMALLCLIFKTGFVRKDMYQDFDTLYGQVNVLP